MMFVSPAFAVLAAAVAVVGLIRKERSGAFVALAIAAACALPGLALLALFVIVTSGLAGMTN